MRRFRNIKSLVLSVFAAAVVLFGMPAMALAQPVNTSSSSDGSGVSQTDIHQNLCNGSSLTFSGNSSCSNGEATQKLDSIITTIVNIFTIIIGIIAVFMIIIGGFKYITSGGESSNVSSAKNTILYAIVGLVIVALAQVIVRFVLNQLGPGAGSVGGY